jgi:enoyl-CoA hydratase/carnithine racemase
MIYQSPALSRVRHVMTIVVSQPSPAVLQALLDRPASRNAINLEMVHELGQVISNNEARVIILGSTSEKALSAGVDLRLSDADRAEVSRKLYGLYEMMRNTEAIVVVAVSGHAIGGGAQLMLASDVRIASPDATIRFRGPGHGLAVGAWGLPGLIGRGRAIDLALTMRPIAAAEAQAIGLIERINDEPLRYAASLAEEITRLSPSAVAAIKRIVGIPDPIEALRAERDHNDAWDGAIPGESEHGSDLAR